MATQIENTIEGMEADFWTLYGVLLNLRQNFTLAAELADKLAQHPCKADVGSLFTVTIECIPEGIGSGGFLDDLNKEIKDMEIFHNASARDCGDWAPAPRMSKEREYASLEPFSDAWRELHSEDLEAVAD
jgi:hypothetical protein